MERKWYCYVCGEKLGKDFLLWSMNERTDRVFLACLKELCFSRLKSDEVIIIKIKETLTKNRKKGK